MASLNLRRSGRLAYIPSLTLLDLNLADRYGRALVCPDIRDVSLLTSSTDMHRVIHFLHSHHRGKTVLGSHHQEAVGLRLSGVHQIYNIVRIPCTKPAHQGLLNYDFPRPQRYSPVAGFPAQTAALRQNPAGG